MSLKKGWEYHVDEDVEKYLVKIPQNDTLRIVATIDEIAKNPFAGDIKKLQGQKDTWRRRVGAYRILYKTLKDKNLILVLDVARRTSTTY